MIPIEKEVWSAGIYVAYRPIEPLVNTDFYGTTYRNLPVGWCEMRSRFDSYITADIKFTDLLRH